MWGAATLLLFLLSCSINIRLGGKGGTGGDRGYPSLDRYRGKVRQRRILSREQEGGRSLERGVGGPRCCSWVFCSQLRSRVQ